MNHASGFLDRRSREPANYTLFDRAGSDDEIRSRFDWVCTRECQEFSSMWFEEWAEKQDGGQAIESPGPKMVRDRAVLRIEKQRIEEEQPAVAMDFIPAGIPPKRPSFSPRQSPGGNPIDQNEIARSCQVKLLTLVINRLRKTLNRVRRENEKGVRRQICLEAMSAGQMGWVAVYLGGSLRAKETARAGVNSQIEAGLISRDHSAAKVAGIGPHTFPSGSRCQQSERRSRPGAHHRTAARHFGHPEFSRSIRRFCAGHGEGLMDNWISG